MGLWQAGWEPIGVDNNPTALKRYPFQAIKKDVTDRDFPVILQQMIVAWSIALIIAGPPCQGNSTTHTNHNPTSHKQTLTRNHRSEAHPPQDIILLLRGMLRATGTPWIIENVPGAPLNPENTIQLCGSSFGLRVRRHRHFEHSDDLPLTAPPCTHAWQDDLKSFIDTKGRHTGVVQVFGTSSKGIKLRNPPNPTQSETEIARIAMGINWMSARDLSQAIPPAYTRHLGRQALQIIMEQGTTAKGKTPRQGAGQGATSRSHLAQGMSRNGHRQDEHDQLATGRKP